MATPSLEAPAEPAPPAARSGPLDELWQAPALGAVMLAGEGLALLLSLSPGYGGDRSVYFGLASLMIQWIALLTLGGLYLLRRRLVPWQPQSIAWLTLGLLLASTWLVGLLAWGGLLVSWPDLEGNASLFLLKLTGMALTVGILGLAAFNNHWRTRQLAVQAKQFELEALQARIRPHFLFNTLNTGAALVHARPSEAERLLLDLADLFRAALSDKREVSLDHELSLARRYLEIERLRFGDRLRVTWEVPARLPKVMVPALSIQPLVENAIRHGVEPSPTGADVEMHVTIDGDVLRIAVSNDLPGNGARATGGHKVGLSSARERIHALSGGGKLVTRTENGRHIAEICLPLPVNAWEDEDNSGYQAITR